MGLLLQRPRAGAHALAHYARVCARAGAGAREDRYVRLPLWIVVSGLLAGGLCVSLVVPVKLGADETITPSLVSSDLVSGSVYGKCLGGTTRPARSESGADLLASAGAHAGAVP